MAEPKETLIPKIPKKKCIADDKELEAALVKGDVVAASGIIYKVLSLLDEVIIKSVDEIKKYGILLEEGTIEAPKQVKNPAVDVFEKNMKLYTTLIEKNTAGSKLNGENINPDDSKAEKKEDDRILKEMKALNKKIDKFYEDK